MPLEAHYIQAWFQNKYPQYRSIPWIEIKNKTRPEVAEILNSSAIYLSLAQREAMPLSVLEGMKSGCLVAGFTGFGQHNPFFNDSNGYWANYEDFDACADLLAQAVSDFLAGDLYRGLNAHQQVSQVFNKRRFYQQIQALFEDILPLNLSHRPHQELATPKLDLTYFPV